MCTNGRLPPPLLLHHSTPLTNTHPQASSGSAPISAQVVSERFPLPEAAHTRLVIVNGTLRPELSDLSGLPDGVYVGGIQGAPATAAKLLVRCSYPTSWRS